MKQQRMQHTLPARAALFVAMVAAMASCSMMSEDRSDCPSCYNPLRVTLRYDYNIQRANMFNDHVEEATVYVTEPQTGRIVDMQQASNTATAQPLRSTAFAFNFEDLPQGDYRLYATARSASAKHFAPAQLNIGDNISALTYQLPDALSNAQLDTLWNTLRPTDVSVKEYDPTEATVGLMRLTNNLNVTIQRTDEPMDNSADRYTVGVSDPTRQLAYDNTPADAAGRVAYQPYAAWTTETTADGTAAERVAHYDLSLFRLVSHDDARQNARLTVVGNEDGQVIADIDLVYYLALMRSSLERDYSVQEFLDREYDYHINLFVENNRWKYMILSINVTKWSIRVQNEAL